MLGDGGQFAGLLVAWYRRNRRDLPWRAPMGAAAGVHPPAYHVLLSEVMLQQTQVATVIPYFHRFVERFPTIQRLASADEQEVLRHWQGLGYYSRARNLQKAAREVVSRFGGIIPDTVEQLLELPGIGRYTAGAVASLAYGVPAPIVDGNVQRVICRVDGITADPREREVTARIWRRAEELVPAETPGEFNSGLMELGATVCTPRNPQCGVCAVRGLCEAAAKGLQEAIPPAKKAMVRPVERRWVFCIERHGRWLIEQRPAKGRWAGMWQFVTREARETLDLREVAQWVGVPVTKPVALGSVKHDLTHRRYEFAAWRCEAREDLPSASGQAWTTLDGLANYPLPKPHLRVARMLRDLA